MSATRDTDGIFRAWLDLMPNEAPDRVLTAVHEVVDTTPQMRLPFGAISRRTIPMTRLAWAAVIAVLGAILAGGVLFVGSSNQKTLPAPAPATSSPSAKPTSTPSPSPTATLTTNLGEPAVRQGAPSRLRTDWVADVPAIDALGFAGGPVTLTIDDTGQTISSTPVGTAGAFDSTIDLVFYRYNFQLTKDFGDCPAGGHALYKGTETKGANDIPVTLEFFSISEPCPARADLLERAWTRQDAATAASPAP